MLLTYWWKHGKSLHTWFYLINDYTLNGGKHWAGRTTVTKHSFDLTYYIIPQAKWWTMLDLVIIRHEVVIAQWLARQLVTEKNPGSNPSKGESIFRQIWILFSCMTWIYGTERSPKGRFSWLIWFLKEIYCQKHWCNFSFEIDSAKECCSTKI